MKRIKYLVCLLLIGALLVPYTVFAENNTEYGYGEGVVSDPLAAKQTSTFSLAATSSLSENEIALLRYLTSKIPELNATIEIPEEYRVSESRFKEIYINYMGSLLQFEHPEIFYLSDAFGYGYLMDTQHTVTSLNLYFKPEYASGNSANASKIKEAQDIIDAEISSITSACEGMSDLQKALYVHDYIVTNYEYDTRVYSDEEGVDGNRTLDKMIEEKTGVCQGYTYLYMTAMKQLGIDCIAVPTDELHHVWNKVKLDGQWYNVDVTYDDPISENIISASHRYFLVNDDEIKSLDPSNTELEAYLLVNNTAYIIESPAVSYGSGNTVTITGNDGTVAVSGVVYSYPYEFAGQTGWNVVYSNGTAVALYKVTEHSCHVTWNSTTWDGKSVEVSKSTNYSYSPLHSISGPTVYTDGSFFCFDAYNNLCEIIFENSQQILRERYVLSRDYKWFVQGQHNSYYTSPYIDNIPFYSSTVALYNGRVYFNSPNTVYEFDTKKYTVKEIYKYNGTPDISETYLYGLRASGSGLRTEYSTEPFADVMMIDIPVAGEPAPTAAPTEKPAPAPTVEPTQAPTPEPTAEPTAEPANEVFPDFGDELPVEKPTVVQTEVTDITTNEETGEEITSYEVTLSVDIPENVHETANEVEKPVMVSVAKYNEFGGFIGFEIVEVDQNNQAKFEADSTCDIIKMFIWAGFIMPLSEPGEYQLGQITE